MITGFSSRLSLPVSERDHIRGADTASVTLVEYGDYECFHCGAAYPIVEALLDRFGHEVRFAYRHFPLRETHPHAEPAAETAEAAANQDLFWEMHETLFTHQFALDAPLLIRYAAQLGIDRTWLMQALAQHTFQKRVHEDFISGVRSGVNGTPTFFIDEIRYDGPPDLLSQAVRRAVEIAGPNVSHKS